MSLLTEQEIDTLAEKHFHTLADKPYFAWFDYTKAIEAKVIEKIKAQGAVAYISPNIAAFHGIGTGTGEFSYVKTWNRTIPLYKLPEGD